MAAGSALSNAAETGRWTGRAVVSSPYNEPHRNSRVWRSACRASRSSPWPPCRRIWPRRIWPRCICPRHVGRNFGRRNIYRGVAHGHVPSGTPRSSAVPGPFHQRQTNRPGSCPRSWRTPEWPRWRS